MITIPRRPHLSTNPSKRQRNSMSLPTTYPRSMAKARARPSRVRRHLAPQNALYVNCAQPHAFARILSIDPSEALALPGVACVLTWKDCPRIPITGPDRQPEPSPHDRFILDEYVRYVGDECVCRRRERSDRGKGRRARQGGV